MVCKFCKSKTNRDICHKCHKKMTIPKAANHGRGKKMCGFPLCNKLIVVGYSCCDLHKKRCDKMNISKPRYS